MINQTPRHYNPAKQHADLTITVSTSVTLPCFLRQGLSLNLELTVLS